MIGLAKLLLSFKWGFMHSERKYTQTSKAENCVVNFKEHKWASSYINTCLGMCGTALVSQGTGAVLGCCVEAWEMIIG